MDSKRLDNAALAAGISPNYINAHGKPQSISAETRRRLLDAMHRTPAATKGTASRCRALRCIPQVKRCRLPLKGRANFTGC